MAKMKIKEVKRANKDEGKPATLQERWASDPVPFRVYRNGKWINAGELGKEGNDG